MRILEMFASPVKHCSLTALVIYAALVMEYASSVGTIGTSVLIGLSESLKGSPSTKVHAICTGRPLIFYVNRCHSGYTAGCNA